MISGAPFTLRVEAEEDLRTFLPDRWEEYLARGDARETVLLRIGKTRDLDGLTCADGWSLCPVGGKEQAVFAASGKTLFAVDFSRAPSEVGVLVRRKLGTDVRLGMQFGLLTALHRTCVGLHGVTLRCEGQTVILSAQSGTGKTTLSRLLERFAGARVLNGDFALLSCGEEGVMFEPTPFCGSSGICARERVRVDRVVFLSQAKENVWREAGVREAVVSLMSNTFVPPFDARMRGCVQEGVARTASMLRVSGYAFAPTGEAALLFRDMLRGERPGAGTA